MTSLLNIAGNIPVVEAGGQSLRFEDGDSPYLSLTPSSAGNQDVWTFSAWVKRGNIGTIYPTIFSAGTTTTDNFMLRFSADKFDVYWRDITTTNRNLTTNALYRDCSAWYHVVLAVDTTDATAANRMRLYVNGDEVTSFSADSRSTLSSSSTLAVNDAVLHTIGTRAYNNTNYYEGYIANACFIDGQQLDPTSFGEYDGTLWRPKSDADITGNLTFGTNGFYLPFKQTTEAEGFSTVTYTGNGGTQSIEGVGFEPDLVWAKARNGAFSHGLFDSVRGATQRLQSQSTAAEDTTGLTSFDTGGFTTSNYNSSGYNYVAWCWDAGSGSAVSNTDGSITSTVKANTAKGFSIVSYTGTGANATVGHGLSSAPEMIITKWRTGGTTQGWPVYHSSIGNTKYLALNLTDAESANSTLWNNTSPTSTNFSIGTNTWVNGSSWTYISYCFHSVSGYSSIGSYTGTGAAGNSITGLGFKPAFLLIKRTDASGDSWIIHDNTRSPSDTSDNILLPNSSSAEVTNASYTVDFDADGFTLQTTNIGWNASGGSYIYMAFADTRDATFFGDTSGNGNNWTPNALNNTDVVPDSPVSGGNFATLSPLAHNLGTASSAIFEGNLKVKGINNTNRSILSTHAVTSGKWYFEIVFTMPAGYNAGEVGFREVSQQLVNRETDNSLSYGVVMNQSGAWGKRNSGTYTSISTSNYTSGSTVVGVAFDADAGTFSISKDGVWENNIFTSIPSGTYQPFATVYYDSGNFTTSTLNFGQDSSFAGNATPQGNTDANGVGDFYYAPPSGFLALTTGNLPTPTITAPDEYFNTLLWTGDGTSSRALTNVGFRPDWVWIKARSLAYNHQLLDSVRGAGTSSDSKSLVSNNAEAESWSSAAFGFLSSFDSDGFTFTAGSTNNDQNNASGSTYVAWNWLAGNSTSSNTDGSITSTVSANQTAGFSVVSYTGNGSNATIGHGLGVVPSMIIHKRRDSTADWNVYHASLGHNSNIVLNTTAVSYTSTTWSNTAPTSSVYSIVAGANTNAATYIAYCFAEVEGYSKIGSYIGNGSTDGTFVHCGFRPAFVMVKNASAVDNWHIVDNTRSTYNLVDDYLSPNASSAESTFPFFDFTSNGFKNRSTGGHNTSGQTIIFMAFAEAPFKSANAR